MSLYNDDRWRATADAVTRMQYPDEYWCIADDDWVQYFWAEQTVSREEYFANSGKDDCTRTSSLGSLSSPCDPTLTRQR